MNDQGKNLELSELILSVLNDLDNSTNTGKFTQLQKRMKEDPVAADYYVEFMEIYSGLFQLVGLSISLEQFNRFAVPSSEEILREVIERDELRREKRAAEEARRAAEIKKEEVRIAAEAAFKKFQEDERRQLEKLAYKQYRARQRKLILGISSLAATLIFVVVAWLFQPKLEDPAPDIPVSVAPPIVATLTEARGAQWDNPQLVAEPGTQLTASPMKLRRGLVKIAFDDGAKIVLQAPCEFKLENTNQMLLESGNLAVVVPKRAQGFTVRTSGATIVDYGTEFGVTAHATGETEAHVFKGEVDLRSGSDIKVYQQSQRLRSGEANRVDRAGIISQKKFKANRQRFIREITEEESFGRPGQRLDLADVIGGGNGFGTDREGLMLDPATGELITYEHLAKRGWFIDSSKSPYELNTHTDQLGSGQYLSVPSTPFIDGVFVPDAVNGSLKISSANHRFTECPDTNNQFWAGIFNKDKVRHKNNFIQVHPMKLDGNQYGTSEQPGIFMHANVGVTFDLHAIRLALPGTRISRFHALCGMADSDLSGTADFWVLVDGQVRFKSTGARAESKAENVRIWLSDTDRFLTLVTTDYDQNNGSDWCIFAKPSLELTAIIN